MARLLRLFAPIFFLACSCNAGASVSLIQLQVVGSERDLEQPPPPPPPPVTLITSMVPLATFGAEYLAAWSIDIDTDAMRSGPQSIALYLPDQPPDVINQLHWEARSGYVESVGGEFVPNPVAQPDEFSWRWYGKSDRFTVALTMVDGALAGRIGAPNDIHYEIAPSPSGELLGITNSAFWETHLLGDEPALLGSNDTGGGQLDSLLPPTAPTGGWDYTCSSSLKSGFHDVDVLLMYTSGILTAYGSIAAVSAAGQAALDDANQALRNVFITSYTYTLIGVTAVDTSHPYDSETITLALDQLSGIQRLTSSPWCNYPGNAYVSGQRTAQHADIVALARRDAIGENTCGVSRAQHRSTQFDCVREVGPGYSPFAYMVFDPGCNADRLNMAHEMGHLLGMEHDPRNADLSGALASCPWSFGHRRSDGTTTNRFNFRTIMAYWQGGSGTAGPPGCLSSAGCPQIDAYSDPNLEWDGLDDGINPPPWGLNPVGALSGAFPIGVALPVGGRRAARAIDTLQRLAPVVEAFYARPDQIFANGFDH